MMVGWYSRIRNMGNRIVMTPRAARHTDSVFGSESEPIIFRASLLYTVSPQTLGGVESQGQDVTIVRPAPSIKTLADEIHLEAQFHRQNSRTVNVTEYPNDGQSLFDLAILDLVKNTLIAENYDYSTPDVNFKYLKLRMLMKARSLDPVQDTDIFIEHLQTVDDDVRDELDIDNIEKVLDGLWTYQQENHLTPAEKGVIDRATTRAVFAAFRNGIRVPEATNELFGFDKYKPPFDARHVEISVRHQALRNWVRFLLDNTTGTLKFGQEITRSSDTTIETEGGPRLEWDIEQVLGLLASAALIKGPIDSAEYVAKWHYDSDNVPDNKTVDRYLRDRVRSRKQVSQQKSTVPSIEDQFEAAHRATIDLARDLNFSFQPVSLAADMYRIPWTSKKKAQTITRPRDPKTGATEEWTYSLLSIVDRKSRFTLGVDHLLKKEDNPTAVSNQLDLLPEYIEVDSVYADSEEAVGDLFDVLRDNFSDNWVVNAPLIGTVINNLVMATPNDRVGIVENISWNARKKTNAFAYPYNSVRPTNNDWKMKPLEKPIIFSHRYLNNKSLRKELKNEREDKSLPESGQATFNSITKGSISKNSSENFGESPDDVDDFAKVPGVTREGTHRVFFTDKDLRKANPTELRNNYYKRWAIEDSINQVKNHFRPRTGSKESHIRIYYTHASVLFQNWHTLINRCRSPYYQLILRVDHNELLQAIQDVAFSSYPRNERDA